MADGEKYALIVRTVEVALAVAEASAAVLEKSPSRRAKDRAEAAFDRAYAAFDYVATMTTMEIEVEIDFGQHLDAIYGFHGRLNALDLLLHAAITPDHGDCACGPAEPSSKPDADDGSHAEESGKRRTTT